MPALVGQRAIAWELLEGLGLAEQGNWEQKAGLAGAVRRGIGRAEEG